MTQGGIGMCMVVRKDGARLLALFFVLVVVFFSGSTAKGEQSNDNPLALDLVVVIDQSKSMRNDSENYGPNKSSDWNGYRMDAAAMMMSLCDFNESRIAFVTFSDQALVNDQMAGYMDRMIKLSEIDTNTISVVVNRLNEMRNTVGPNTDLGAAVKKAVELLDKHKKTRGKRHPVILLLTDGEIDIRNGQGAKDKVREQLSKDMFMEAVELAKKDGIQAYTLALMPPYGSKPSISMLNQLSLDTGAGSTKTVTSAEDLPSFFNQIFADKIGSEVNRIKTKEIQSKDGWSKVTFEIPNNSVKEAIVLLNISGIEKAQVFNNPELSLVSPSGTEIRNGSNGNVIVMTSGTTFRSYKITRPESGVWTIQYKKAQKEDGTTLNVAEAINLVYSYDLLQEVTLYGASVNKAESVFAKNDTLTIESRFLATGGDGKSKPSEDSGLYQKGIKATLVLMEENGKTPLDGAAALEMDGDGKAKCFRKEIALKDLRLEPGTYSVRIHYEGDGMKRDSDLAFFHVKNRPPENQSDVAVQDERIHDPAEDSEEKFVNEKPITVDFSKNVIDPDEDILSWKLIYGDEDDILCDVALDTETGTLTASTNNKTGTQKITVQAVDPNGEKTEVSALITVTNVRENIEKSWKVIAAVNETSPEKIAEVTVSGALYDGEKQITNPLLLKHLKLDGEYTIKGQNVQNTREDLSFNTSHEASFTTESNEAEYAITVNADLRGITLKVEQPEKMTVGNLAPVIVDEVASTLTTSFTADPFLWGNADERGYQVDLTQLFDDPNQADKQRLTFSVTGEDGEAPPAEIAVFDPEKNMVTLTNEWLDTNYWTCNPLKLFTDNRDTSERTLVMTATDPDGKSISHAYAFTVISQKQQVFNLIEKIVFGIISVVLLIFLWYWLIFRKSWSKDYGTITVSVGNIPMAETPNLYGTGKKDRSMKDLLIARSQAATDSTVREGLSCMGAYTLRPKGGKRVQIKLDKKEKRKVPVLSVGNKQLTKKGGSLIWGIGQQVSFTAGNTTFTLSRNTARNRNAARRP